MGRKVENAHCRNTEGLVDGMDGVNLFPTCFGLLAHAYVEFLSLMLYHYYRLRGSIRLIVIVTALFIWPASQRPPLCIIT
jgi:hypothetical protein